MLKDFVLLDTNANRGIIQGAIAFPEAPELPCCCCILVGGTGIATLSPIISSPPIRSVSNALGLSADFGHVLGGTLHCALCDRGVGYAWPQAADQAQAHAI